MSTFAHGMKKRLSMATTRTKKLENSISSDYLTAKKRLQRERKALVEAVKYVDTSSTAWEKIAHTQKDFAEIIETEGAIDGPLHVDATRAVSEARDLHQSVVGVKPSENVAKMVNNAKALITEMDQIEAGFKKVETEFNETLRYERKIGKLASKEKKTDKTNANKSKLEQARMTYQGNLDAALGRMNKASGKFEAILQSVQTAFWLTEDSYLRLVSHGSEAARTAALNVADQVAKMDPVLDNVKPVDPSPTSVAFTPTALKTDKEADVVTPAPTVQEPVAA